MKTYEFEDFEKNTLLLDNDREIISFTVMRHGVEQAYMEFHPEDAKKIARALLKLSGVPQTPAEILFNLEPKSKSAPDLKQAIKNKLAEIEKGLDEL